jgi:predicted RNA binding protein YcfA (HicA-like mRNA interferase family)
VPPLPRVTGKQAVKALTHAGFDVFDQSGSHVYLHKWTGAGWSARVTVPVHAGRTLKPKTLSAILTQAGISVEEFTKLL